MHGLNALELEVFRSIFQGTGVCGRDVYTPEEQEVIEVLIQRGLLASWDCDEGGIEHRHPALTPLGEEVWRLQQLAGPGKV